MNKTDYINCYFQRKAYLTKINPLYAKHISDIFHWMIQADNIQNDKTKELFLDSTKSGIAIIMSKQDGIIAGLEEIIFLIKKYTKLRYSQKVKDGDAVTNDTKIITFAGQYTDILVYERTILNILGRMSGIATATQRLIKRTKYTSPCPFLAATRKTPLMFLDKKAVAVGGGLTHRLHLADWALIKDNHLVILKNELSTNSSEKVIAFAIRKMISLSVPFFEIEVETIPQAETAVATFENYKQKNTKIGMAILLDNFDEKKAAYCMKKLCKSPMYESILIEASGGIQAENIALWSKTGVDILSLGYLTHSSQTFDFSMQIV
jgi:nicotinate-nucleotide pyrophosphorylase (carboxylating)